jgi:hypothetical protein
MVHDAVTAISEKASESQEMNRPGVSSQPEDAQGSASVLSGAGGLEGLSPLEGWATVRSKQTGFSIPKGCTGIPAGTRVPGALTPRVTVHLCFSALKALSAAEGKCCQESKASPG